METHLDRAGCSAHLHRSNSKRQMLLYSSRNSCTSVGLLVRLDEKRERAREKRVPSGADARIIYPRTARQQTQID